MNVLARNNVYYRAGEGPVLMFAHGFGCDQTMWQDVVSLLPEEYGILLFDLVGAGKSDLLAYDREKYGDLFGHATDVLEVLDELELEHVIFVGHSVSAMIGVLAVKRQKRNAIGKLALVGPSPRYINEGDYIGGFSQSDIEELLEALDANYLGWSRAMAPVIMGADDRPELNDRLTESFCQTDPAIARHFARVTFLSDNRTDLPDVEVPALVIQSRKDAIAPPTVGEYVARNLPRGRMIIVNVNGHCPHVSAPSEIVSALNHFLKASA